MGKRVELSHKLLAIEKMQVKRSGLTRNLPWLVALAVVWTISGFATPLVNAYYFSIVIYVGINVVLAVSLNLVNGFTGQFSMGHAGFMAIGGYTSAFLTTSLRSFYPTLMSHPFAEQGIFIGALIIGALVASVAGYLVGLPSLRLKGDYLAIVTLGFGEIIRVFLLNIEAIGGARGMPGIPSLSSFGWVYTFALITVFVIARLTVTPIGREFLGVREDEIASEAMGVNTTQAKVRAFVIGAFFAGIGGGLFAHFLSYLNPSTFDFNKSFDIIIMVVLGGMGSITGSVIAACLLTVLREGLRSLQEITHIDFRMIIYSMILILMMILRPNGLFGTKEIWEFLPFRNFKQKKKSP